MSSVVTLCVCVRSCANILTNRPAYRSKQQNGVWESVTLWKTGGQLWGHWSNYTWERDRFRLCRQTRGAKRREKTWRNQTRERKSLLGTDEKKWEEMEEFQCRSKSNTITASASATVAAVAPSGSSSTGFTPALFVLHPAVHWPTLPLYYFTFTVNESRGVL